MRRPTLVEIVWAVAIVCGVAPLWASQNIPLVDLPQHLHLISVLHRLDDASTLFPEFFARRPELTPYLGYYYVVSLLNWAMPLELANRVFLTAVIAGLPLSLAFLLKSLQRPTWPALLALPFAWGDSFAWGFVNYCASLPLALLTCGLFVRTITSEAIDRRKWVIGSAISLVFVLLFHVQSFIWLAFALPLLLLTTPAPEGKHWRARIPALISVSPGVLIFLVWVSLRLSHPSEIAPGQPWKAWGPMFSKENVAWKSFDQNVNEFVTFPRNQQGGLEAPVFPMLAGMVPDQTDQRAVRLVFLITIGAVITRLAQLRAKANDTKEGTIARWRIVALAALAFALLFLTPFDIRGFVYAMNTRYVHLAAALLVAAVPVLNEKWAQRYAIAAGLAAVVLMAPLWSAFRAFDLESRGLFELAKSAGPKPKVMGLIYGYGTMSRAVTHPLYLHSSCVIARERGGLTNFSFASTPHSPLMYQGALPPTFPSEWHPETMNWEAHGKYYDHFVIRGARPEQIFGQLLQTELYVAAQEGDFFLVRRR